MSRFLMFEDLNPVPEFPPQGAINQGDGKFTWRIWAPKVEGLKLIASPDDSPRELPLAPAENGYYVCELPVEEAPEGMRYAYRFPDGRTLPDPFSRWQPETVHKASAVVHTNNFQWTDSNWRGVERQQLVIYELHIGTFTPEGTFDAAIARLDQLADLGVTALEIMPIAQFPGERNWGYDGVFPYAAQNSYGGPQGFARLVDAAHGKGLAVLLDVVYNHLGPEGNYLGEFGPYFTDKYHTPWGKALNYDGRDSEPVRRFAIDNALMWIKEFHIDGLRMDACQFILDEGSEHILAELQRCVQTVAANLGRRVIVIGETDQNDPKLTNSADRGGFGLDGVWSDCFHHAVHCHLTGEHDGWYADFGQPEHVAKAFSETFCHDGGWSKYRKRRHGKRLPICDRSP
ncbi:MAG TPA: alpha-amylase family glycosyl hydrolase, partial [Pirellulales bacterium]